MPIETKHPQWEMSIYAWQKSRDTLGGEKIIKSKNTKYLDMPAAMEVNDSAPSSGGSGTEENYVLSVEKSLPGDDREYDPTWHPNPAYRAYLRRAKFPDIAAYTVRGLIGLVTKRDPDFELPSTLAYLEDEFTKDGKSLIEFFKYAVNEVLKTGRLPCIVDVVEDRLKVVTYTAESHTNWRDGSYAVFEESKKKESDDMFLHESEPAYRTLYIDPVTGNYNATLLKEGDVTLPDESDDTLINFKGKTRDEIPIVIIGSTNLDSDVDQIPIEGISDCAIQIYRKTADLSNSQYMSCNPTLIGIGVGEDDKPTALGATVAWLIGNEEARVEYTKTDTSALQHVKDDINDLFEEAANYGAHLLGTPKKGAEAAESIRLQQSATGATLASVVDTVGMGIIRLIEIIAEWSGTNGKVIFEGSKEFSDMVLSAAEIKELREGWMSGAHSHETYLYNIKRAGVIPEERSIDDELNLIDGMGNNNNGGNA